MKKYIYIYTRDDNIYHLAEAYAVTCKIVYD